ncbi:MAG TPA: AprI/Inh family metalloprotease inhibitor [Pseudolabrys sp.]|nr:AprI/Inh family metalloprotease inhibitor [Pseudolabrys sp.]
MRRATGLTFAILSFALAGCGGGAGSLMSDDEKPQAVAAVDAGTEGMEGRWLLAAPNAPSCGLTFTGPPGAREGRVTPDGGCPERFFLARRWRLADDALTVVDGDGASLGTFRNAGDRFEGKSAAETTITLSR